MEIQKRQEDIEPQKTDRQDWQKLERQLNKKVVRVWERPKEPFTRSEYVSALPTAAKKPSPPPACPTVAATPGLEIQQPIPPKIHGVIEDSDDGSPSPIPQFFLRKEVEISYVPEVTHI